MVGHQEIGNLSQIVQEERSLSFPLSLRLLKIFFQSFLRLPIKRYSYKDIRMIV